MTYRVHVIHTIRSVTASRRAGFAAPLTRSGTIVVAGSEIKMPRSHVRGRGIELTSLPQ
jgi:hypothetical protein